MKNLSTAAKVYILGTILIGLGLIGWMATELDWANLGLYLLSSPGRRGSNPQSRRTE